VTEVDQMYRPPQ